MYPQLREKHTWLLPINSTMISARASCEQWRPILAFDTWTDNGTDKRIVGAPIRAFRAENCKCVQQEIYCHLIGCCRWSPLRQRILAGLSEPTLGVPHSITIRLAHSYYDCHCLPVQKINPGFLSPCEEMGKEEGIHWIFISQLFSKLRLISLCIFSTLIQCYFYSLFYISMSWIINCIRVQTFVVQTRINTFLFRCNYCENTHSVRSQADRMKEVANYAGDSEVWYCLTFL